MPFMAYPRTDSRYLTDDTAEKRESKLQKAVDAANKLIAKLKAEIDSLKQEISDYKVCPQQAPCGRIGA